MVRKSLISSKITASIYQILTIGFRKESIMEPLIAEDTWPTPIPVPFIKTGHFDDVSDDALVKRFSRTSREPKSLIYEFTRDEGYLHQYFRLREEMFIRIWGLENFNGSRDEFDDLSDIVVARIGNLVVGGARMTFTSALHPQQLPMEKDDFILRERVPYLFVGNRPVVEISRLAILPEYQNSMVMVEICRDMLKLAIQKRAAYGVSVAPLALARNYRKVMCMFGLEGEIQRKIVMPEREEYEGIKMAFSIMNLAPLYGKVAPSAEKAKVADLLDAD